MNKKRVADNNRQNEYMQCATLWGECFVKHNGQGWLLIGFDLCYSTVQVIAMWNLHRSSSFEGLRCPSAQPAQPADRRPVSPSLTTWQRTAEPRITKLIKLPVQYSKQALKIKRCWYCFVMQYYSRCKELWAWHYRVGLLYERGRNRQWKPTLNILWH